MAGASGPLIIERWRTQMRRGYLELCVLALISVCRRSYGFDMMERLRVRGIDVREGTLYPLLARMEGEGLLASNWETQALRGPPRKLYRLTEVGKAALSAMHSEFCGLNDVLNGFLTGENPLERGEA